MNAQTLLDPYLGPEIMDQATTQLGLEKREFYDSFLKRLKHLGRNADSPTTDVTQYMQSIDVEEDAQTYINLLYNYATKWKETPSELIEQFMQNNPSVKDALTENPPVQGVKAIRAKKTSGGRGRGSSNDNGPLDVERLWNRRIVLLAERAGLSYDEYSEAVDLNSDWTSFSNTISKAPPGTNINDVLLISAPTVQYHQLKLFRTFYDGRIANLAASNGLTPQQYASRVDISSDVRKFAGWLVDEATKAQAKSVTAFAKKYLAEHPDFLVRRPPKLQQLGIIAPPAPVPHVPLQAMNIEPPAPRVDQVKQIGVVYTQEEFEDMHRKYLNEYEQRQQILRDKNAMEADLANIKQKANDLTTQLNLAKELNEQMRVAGNEYETKWKALLKENTDWIKLGQEIEAKLKAAEEKITQLTINAGNANAENEAILAELQRQVSYFKSELEREQRDVQIKLQNSNQAFDELVEKYNSTYDQLSQVQIHASNQEASYKRELEKKAQALLKLSQEAEKTKIELQNYSAALNEAKKQAEINEKRLLNQMQVQDENIQQLKKVHKEAMADLQKQFDRVSQELTAATSEIGQLKIANDQAKRDIEACTHALNIAKQERDAARTDLQNLRSADGNKDAQYNALKKELEDREKDVYNLQKELEECKKSGAAIRQEYNSYQEEKKLQFAKMKKDHETILKIKTDEYEKRIEQLRKQNEDQFKDLEMKSQEIAKLQADIAKGASADNIYKRQYNALQAHVERLQKEFVQKTNEFDSLNNKYNEMMKNHTGSAVCEAKLQALQTQLQLKEEEINKLQQKGQVIVSQLDGTDDREEVIRRKPLPLLPQPKNVLPPPIAPPQPNKRQEALNKTRAELEKMTTDQIKQLYIAAGITLAKKFYTKVALKEELIADFLKNAELEREENVNVKRLNAEIFGLEMNIDNYKRKGKQDKLKAAQAQLKEKKKEKDQLLAGLGRKKGAKGKAAGPKRKRSEVADEVALEDDVAKAKFKKKYLINRKETTTPEYILKKAKAMKNVASRIKYLYKATKKYDRDVFSVASGLGDPELEAFIKKEDTKPGGWQEVLAYLTSLEKQEQGPVSNNNNDEEPVFLMKNIKGSRPTKPTNISKFPILDFYKHFGGDVSSLAHPEYLDKIPQQYQITPKEVHDLLENATLQELGNERGHAMDIIKTQIKRITTTYPLSGVQPGSEAFLDFAEVLTREIAIFLYLEDIIEAMGGKKLYPLEKKAGAKKKETDVKLTPHLKSIRDFPRIDRPTVAQIKERISDLEDDITMWEKLVDRYKSEGQLISAKDIQDSEIAVTKKRIEEAKALLKSKEKNGGTTAKRILGKKAPKTKKPKSKGITKKKKRVAFDADKYFDPKRIDSRLSRQKGEYKVKASQMMYPAAKLLAGRKAANLGKDNWLKKRTYANAYSKLPKKKKFATSDLKMLTVKQLKGLVEESGVDLKEEAASLGRPLRKEDYIILLGPDAVVDVNYRGAKRRKIDAFQFARTVVDEEGNAHLLEVARDIHSIRENMIATAGVALPGKKRVEVNPLRCLFPDSGAVVNEMTYEVAKKLGLYNRPPPSNAKAIRIQATGHSYDCLPAEVLLSISPEDLRRMTDEGSLHSPMRNSRGLTTLELPDNLKPVTRKIKIYYPIKKYQGHNTNWDILLGTEGAIAFNIVLRFAK